MSAPENQVSAAKHHSGWLLSTTRHRWSRFYIMGVLLRDFKISIIVFSVPNRLVRPSSGQDGTDYGP